MGKMPVRRAPRILEQWVATWLGQVALTLLFTLGLLLAGQPLLGAVPLVVLCARASNRFLAALSLFSLLGWLLGAAFEQKRMGVSFDMLQRFAAVNEAPVLAARCGAVVAFAALLAVAYRGLRGRRVSPAAIVTGLLALLALTAGSAKWLGGENPAGLLLWGLAILLGKCFWYLAYAAGERGHRGLQLKHSGLLFPLWGFFQLENAPVPRGFGEIESNRTRTAAEVAAVQLSGLKLLYWCVILALTGRLLAHSVFGYPDVIAESLGMPRLDLPNYYQTGLAKYNQMNLPWQTQWFLVLAQFLRFAIEVLAVGAGVIVSLARLCGIEAFRHVYKPYRARSFNDFCRRLYHYYFEILIQFFFVPAWRLFFRFRLRRKARLFFATLCAVSVGSFTINSLRHLEFFASMNTWDWLGASLLRWPYFLGLGLACAVSAVSARPGQRAPMVPWRPLFYFVFYAFIFALEAGYPYATAADKLTFVAALFGVAL